MPGACPSGCVFRPVSALGAIGAGMTCRNTLTITLKRRQCLSVLDAPLQRLVAGLQSPSFDDHAHCRPRTMVPDLSFSDRAAVAQAFGSRGSGTSDSSAGPGLIAAPSVPKSLLSASFTRSKLPALPRAFSFYSIETSKSGWPSDCAPFACDRFNRTFAPPWTLFPLSVASDHEGPSVARFDRVIGII